MTLTGSGYARGRLKRQVLRDDVSQTLLDMLLQEELKPGATLSIDGLAKELGISPTPMREALAYLEHTGLVARAALKGYKVAPRLSPDQMRELSEARAVVELAAIERIGERAVGLLPQLREAHAEHLSAAARLSGSDQGNLPTAQSVREYFDADWKFHLVLVEGSGNHFLGQMLQGLGAHLHRMVQSAGRGVLDWDLATQEHGCVLAAIESGDDADLAVEAMRQHLAKAQQRALDDAARITHERS